MPHYIYALSQRAYLYHRLAEDGGRVTLCGNAFTASAISTEPPRGRSGCEQCGLRSHRDALARDADTVRESVLLPMLRAGLTNAAMARRVGVGIRTITRWKQELLGRYDSPNLHDVMWRIGHDAGQQGRIELGVVPARRRGHPAPARQGTGGPAAPTYRVPATSGAAR